MRKYLGIATTREPMTLGFEATADIGVVIELTVLYCPNVTCLVRERLVTALDVDDAEAAYSESDSMVEIRSAVVGAAMLHRVGHPVEGRLVDDGSRLTAQLHHTANATHSVRTLPVSDYGFDPHQVRPIPSQGASSGTPFCM